MIPNGNIAKALSGKLTKALQLTAIISTEAAVHRCFLGKGVLTTHSKFTGKHPCQSAISIKLQSNFIEITFGMGVLL